MSKREARKPNDTNYATNKSDITDSDIDTHITVDEAVMRSAPADKYQWSRFMLKSSGFFMFLMIPLAVAVVMRLFYISDLRHIYSGWGHIKGNFFFYIAFALFLGILFTISLFAKQVRYFNAIIIFVFLVCYWYLAGLFMVYTSKGKAHHFVTTILLYIAAIIGGLVTFGNVIVLSRKKLQPIISFFVAFAMYGAVLIYLSWYYKNDSAKGHFGENIKLFALTIPSFVLLSGACAFFAAYLTSTLKQMTKYRTHRIESSNWFAGAVYMHTDILYMFWYEMIVDIRSVKKVEEVHIIRKELIVEEEGPRSRMISYRDNIDL